MWFLIQSSIIFAVVASNIRWHWTPNGYVAGLIGVGLAYVMTHLLASLLKLGQVAAFSFDSPRGFSESRRALLRTMVQLAVA